MATFLSIVAVLWRLRFVIALCVAFVMGCWVIGWWGKTQDLKREKADLIATNQATMEALDRVKADGARNEQISADRAARKAKEADRLGKLVKHLMEMKDEGACPSMPIIDDAIDGL